MLQAATWQRWCLLHRCAPKQPSCRAPGVTESAHELGRSSPQHRLFLLAKACTQSTADLFHLRVKFTRIHCVLDDAKRGDEFAHVSNFNVILALDDFNRLCALPQFQGQLAVWRCKPPLLNALGHHHLLSLAGFRVDDRLYAFACVDLTIGLRFSIPICSTRCAVSFALSKTVGDF